MTRRYERSKFKIFALAISIGSSFWAGNNSAWGNPRSEALCQQALRETKELSTNDLAVKHIDQALAIDPNSAYYWLVKAQLLQNLEDSEKALPCINKSLQLNNKPVAAYLLKADILTDLNRYDEALKDINHASMLEPRPEYHHLKARIFKKQHKFDLAESELDAAIKANPKDELAYSQRAAIAGLSKHWPKAIADLTFSINNCKKKNLSHYEDLLARAGAYTETKQYEKAMVDCKEGIKGQPDMPQFHAALLKLYTLTGNKSGAAIERKELKAIDEDYTPAKSFGH